MSATKNEPWALILGASSGFGGATSRELARQGFHIAGVHLDRKATLPNVEQIVADITQTGRKALFFNVNAADPEKRKEVLDQLEPALKHSSPPGQVMVVMHSLAFGTLKPYIAEDPKGVVGQDQMEMTLDVMAHSLVYWTQDLFFRKLIGQGSRIFAMTSSGGARVWPAYGAVSAAKAALESHMRQLALELAPYGITANTIRAGVTDTPALRKIPGSEQMMEFAKLKNPHHRLTTPDDVAKAIATLSNSATQWVTGNVIGVDGGEDIIG
ncbi:MAG: SDR family oxidoreductase [Candidatus Omnitrophica bacterium]|nr:SDR family oxidoreductase [Candidatus Omnitrophota bacterium]